MLSSDAVTGKKLCAGNQAFNAILQQERPSRSTSIFHTKALENEYATKSQHESHSVEKDRN